MSDWDARTASDGWIPLVRVAERVGMTTRQINYWRTCDYIECEYRHRDGSPVVTDDPTFPGSGYVSFVGPLEAERIGVIATLVQRGMNVASAAELADELTYWQSVELSSTVEIRYRATTTAPPTPKPHEEMS